MTKTEFYDSFTSRKIGDRADLVTDRREVHNIKHRKIVATFYTQSVLGCEPRIANIIDLFCKNMDKLSGSGEAFDISVWYRKYTYDAVGALFYGKNEGFSLFEMRRTTMAG